MIAFDQSKMWEALDERRAITDHPRHRQMLDVVIEHAKAEAERSIERLMATLTESPEYHFWVGGRDLGPKGQANVYAYYRDFVKSGGAVFESPKDRVVVDDHNVVSEAEVRNLVPGAVARRRGYHVPDDSGHYLVRFRNVVFFAFGEDPTRALGEDSYTTMDPEAFERVDDAQLPRAYVDYLAAISSTSTAGFGAR
jgi:hypothetical protein